MKYFIGNLKPQVHPNICQETKAFILHGSWKNLHDKVFLIFDKKTIFYPKMMVWRENVYALKSIHHYP